MNILIASAGKRVSLVKFFQKELKELYPGGKVFTTDLAPDIAPACVVSDSAFTVKKFSDPDYISDLLDLCKRHSIKMIVPTLDTELLLLADAKNVFKDAGIHVVVSGNSFVESCRDKRRINAFLEERSIKIPKEISRENITFPLFVKPYNGSLSIDTFLITDSFEMQDRFINESRFMLMEYIDPVENDEYTVDMYYGRDHDLKMLVPRKRMQVRAGEISKGVTCKNEVLEELKEKLSHIEGAVGCITTQVFMNKNSKVIHGIEINPRFGGGYPLSYHANANYPKMLIEEYFQDKSIGYSDSWEDNLLMLRYDDEVIVHDFKSR